MINAPWYKALEKLSRARLIKRTGSRRWRSTKHGRHCAVHVVTDSERRRGGKAFGSLVAGAAAERLPNTLDRPMRGVELVERLGVTPQRVHQLIVRLHAQGRVRLSDQGKILHIVARSDDPSLLLTHDEERILSALPDEAATTVPRLAAGARMLSARPGSTQFLEPWWPLDGVLRLSDRARRGGAWLVCAGF